MVQSAFIAARRILPKLRLAPTFRKLASVSVFRWNLLRRTQQIELFLAVSGDRDYLFQLASAEYVLPEHGDRIRSPKRFV
jgi:hypothetical protein